jgi:hypothetical protein
MALRPHHRVVTAVYAATLFLSACLLFSVQPMIARRILPRLGGAPAVWTTCSLFFQVALLAGYAGAHALSRLRFPRQVGVFLTMLAVGAFCTSFEGPGSRWEAHALSNPTWRLLLWLTQSIGIPFVVLAATAPLLQHWYARPGHERASDPYFLYGASNAGSLAALVAYPFWIERTLDFEGQSRGWIILFLALPIATIACAVTVIEEWPYPAQHPAVPTPRPSPGQVAGWSALAAVPSSYMLGVTTYLTTDLAAVPLLWVVPLGLYLISFIVAFGCGSEFATRIAARILPFLVMIQAPVMMAGFGQPWWVPLHLATFFVAAIVCHGALAARRPPVEGLTGFYLAVATGGVLGGAFNALVAPNVFDRLAEYPLALVASCLVLGVSCGRTFRELYRLGDLVLPAVIGSIAAILCANVGGVVDTAIGIIGTMAVTGLTTLVAFRHRRHPARFAWTVGALLAAAGLTTGINGRVIARERNFFGVLTVTEDPTQHARRLFHGNTLHGQQSLDPAHRDKPSTYFDRSGPVGAVFSVLDARPDWNKARIGVTGLGVGSLASYARPGQRWRFFEIDPAVVRVARDPRLFTFLSDCRADTVDVIVGDARLALADEPEAGFDLLILDAFSSDSVPVHLLTREALTLYRSKLRPGGWIVVNLTNRYLDLPPVLARLASDAGLFFRVRLDLRTRKEEAATGVRGSIWGVLATPPIDLGPLATDPLWYDPVPRGSDAVWADEHTDLLRHLRLTPVGLKR